MKKASFNTRTLTEGLTKNTTCPKCGAKLGKQCKDYHHGCLDGSYLSYTYLIYADLCYAELRYASLCDANNIYDSASIAPKTESH